MTPDALHIAAIRAAHTKCEDGCLIPWHQDGCDVSVVLAALDAERAELTTLDPPHPHRWQMVRIDLSARKVLVLCERCATCRWAPIDEEVPR